MPRQASSGGSPGMATRTRAHGALLRHVHQPLDVDHQGLIAAVDQQLGAPPRPRQVDFDRLLDAAGRAGQHDHAVGQKHGLLHAVGHEQHGLAVALPDFQQFLLHAGAGVGIECAERLVHQQDARAVGQRARDGDALLHAAGQFLGIEILVAREVHQRDQRARLLLGLGFGHAALERPVHDVAEHGLPGKQRELLEHRPAVGPGPRHRLAVDCDGALRRLHEAADDIEQRGLAAARRPQDRDELPIRHVERDIRQRQMAGPARRLERLAQPLDGDHGRPARPQGLPFPAWGEGSG